VKKAMEKTQDWMLAADHFRDRISDNDEVLAAWRTLLSDFYQHLPLLLKLSHKALTVKSFSPLCLRKKGVTAVGEYN